MPVTKRDIEAMQKQRLKMQRDMARAQRLQDPQTEKEILDRIYELEYRRISLPKIHHPQIPIVQENITQEIKRLYAKLEALKKSQEQKPNAPNA